MQVLKAAKASIRISKSILTCFCASQSKITSVTADTPLEKKNQAHLEEDLISQCSPLMKQILQGSKLTSKTASKQLKFTMTELEAEEGKGELLDRNHDLRNFRHMLAGQITSEIQLDKFCEKKKCPIIADVKYDGERTLISYEKNVGLQMTSRNNKSQNQSYRRLHQRIQEQLGATDIKSIQVDGEIMALSRETLEPLPFNELQKMKKLKEEPLSLDEEDSTKLIVVYMFDVLEINGQNLLKLPLVQRRKHMPNVPVLKIAQSKTFHFPEERAMIFDYYLDVFERKYEGLILKGSNDPYYTNDSRVHWKKIKRGFSNTRQNKSVAKIELDLVVMGADRGKTIRNSQQISSFLLGVPYQGSIIPISSVGTGFTEATLNYIMEMIQEKKLRVDQVPEEYKLGIVKKDMYFKPELVFQVHAQQLIPSPQYNLGKSEYGGLSLRFPSFKRIRDDKGVSEATKGEEVIEMSKNYNFNLPK